MAGVLKTPLKDDSEFEDVWGMLEIVSGSVPDAPRRIGLVQDQIWMGRAPESKFICNIYTLFATFINPSAVYANVQYPLCSSLRLLGVAVYLGRDIGISAQHCVITKDSDGIMVGDAR